MRKDRGSCSCLSMARGLETRVPFAGERIVEYALPWALKNLDGRGKAILRAAFSQRSFAAC